MTIIDDRPDTSLEIVRLLDRIHKTGTTVLVATHDHGIVDQFRKRVIELERGRLVRDEAVGGYGGDRRTDELTEGDD